MYAISSIVPATMIAAFRLFFLARQRCLLASKASADRYPPITRTFFPDGSFDLEWVDTSLKMVDL